MKKFIVLCLFALTGAISFSFTSNANHPRTRPSLDPKRYIVQLSQTTQIGGCSFTISLVVQFYWEGEEHPVTNVQAISPIIIDVSCSGGSGFARETTLSDITFNASDAHCTDLAFTPTGTKQVDDVLEDNSVINAIKGEMNTQIDMQKD